MLDNSLELDYNNIDSMIQYKITSNGEIRVNCPYCISFGKTLDTKFHMYISPTLGLYHCFRCGSKGMVKNLPEEIQAVVKEVSLLPPPKDLNTLATPALPSGFYENSSRLSDIMYIEGYLSTKLRVPPEILREEAWMFYSLATSDREPWIKFRSLTMGGEEDYFILRKPYSHLFLNPKGVQKKLFKIGIHKLPEVKKLVIVEGVTDALSVYLHSKTPAAAILGKNWVKEQLLETIELADQKEYSLIIALDKDAPKENRTLAKTLRSLVSRATVFRVEYSSESPKDPGEIGNIFGSEFVKIVPERGF